MAGTTLGQLAARFGLAVHGDPDICIDRVATLQRASQGAISFLANSKYTAELKTCLASAVILEPMAQRHWSGAALVTDNPYAAYARIASYLHPTPSVAAGIHSTAVIDASAQIAASAHIGPLVVIGAGAQVGERVVIGAGSIVGAGVSLGADTQLMPRVTIYHSVSLGERCVVHSGAVIGADGFGIAKDTDGWVKVPQLGSVRIGHDVEIGANTTIDRGAVEDTVLEDDVKLDNQIQIGHNVRIGAHTAMAACVGVSGSTTIGKHCLSAGAVGIAGHLHIADHVVVLGQSMVSRSLTERGVYASGVPVSEAGDWRRTVARLRHLDSLFDRVRSLEQQRTLPRGEKT